MLLSKKERKKICIIFRRNEKRKREENSRVSLNLFPLEWDENRNIHKNILQSSVRWKKID